MKKILTLALSLILVMSFAACGGNSETTEVPKDEQEVASNAEESVISETVASTESKDTASDESWREFLEDYEKWVDNYIVLLKKYEANPTDMSILTEYTEMAAEVSEWADKADEIEEDLDAEDLNEYTATLTRIINKLNDALA